MDQLICARCNRHPEDIPGYVDTYGDSGYSSPAQYVWNEEGTLDRGTGYFLCDECYIAVGMPSNRYPEPNWTATIENLKKIGINVD